MSQTKFIREFRRDLRVLEREAVRHLEGETSCCGVTLGQCHAILELSFSDSSLTALAAALDLDTSTQSRTVDGLVKAGWVERTQDAGDRRAVRLALTAAGRAKVAENLPSRNSTSASRNERNIPAIGSFSSTFVLLLASHCHTR